MSPTAVPHIPAIASDMPAPSFHADHYHADEYKMIHHFVTITASPTTIGSHLHNHHATPISQNPHYAITALSELMIPDKWKPAAENRMDIKWLAGVGAMAGLIAIMILGIAVWALTQ